MVLGSGQCELVQGYSVDRHRGYATDAHVCRVIGIDMIVSANVYQFSWKPVLASRIVYDRPEVGSLCMIISEVVEV